jgi:hypothetical protein
LPEIVESTLVDHLYEPTLWADFGFTRRYRNRIEKLAETNTLAYFASLSTMKEKIKLLLTGTNATTLFVDAIFGLPK